MRTVKNILVVNVNWHGDVIFSTPVFKALKDFYPGAKISCLAVPRVHDVLAMNPLIDEIIALDEKKEHWCPWNKLGLVFHLRKKKFDAAFLLHRSLSRAMIVALAGIPQRVGYDEKGRGFLLTKRIAPPKKWLHRADHYLNVIESAGIPVKERGYTLSVPESAQRDVDVLLREQGIAGNDFLVIVNTGGNWDLKRWPKEKFALLMRQLKERYNAKVIIPGAPGDLNLAREIAALSKSDPVILAGRTTWRQLAALMERAQLVISADSGPMHLASAVGTDVIGLFGPTRPEVTGPRGKGKIFILQNDVGCNRAPCYNLACPDNVCMQSITVDEVINRVEQIKG